MAETSGKNIFRKTITALTVGYNKGVILSRITDSAMGIITRKIRTIQNSLETVVTSFEEIRATSESTSNNTDNIYSTMNEIITSTAEVNEAIQNNVKEISTAAIESQKINSLFTTLDQQSKQVQSMTREIDDVAQQTNILAINASIEAARAGNAGKGFHIIAKEIRSLSIKTQEFATNIEGTINNFSSGLSQVQNNFQSLLFLLENFQKDLEKTGETFSNNNKSLENSGYILAEIRAAVSEQTEAMTDGLHSLEHVFALLKDAGAISSALNDTHSSLDQLLNKKS